MNRITQRNKVFQRIAKKCCNSWTIIERLIFSDLCDLLNILLFSYVTNIFHFFFDCSSALLYFKNCVPIIQKLKPRHCHDIICGWESIWKWCFAISVVVRQWSERNGCISTLVSIAFLKPIYQIWTVSPLIIRLAIFSTGERLSFSCSVK